MHDEHLGEFSGAIADVGATVLPGDEFAPVVASRIASNGNEIRVYDYAGGALVLEAGRAYSPRAYLPPKGERLSLLVLWEAIAPNEPPPAALEDLQVRLEYREAGPDSPSVLPPGVSDSIVEAPREMTKAGGLVTNSPVGCSNGCCDYEWLYTFDECNDDYDFDWMLYNNYGETVNSEDVWWYRGFVCAAKKTSRWWFKLGSAKSVAVDVAEGYFLGDFWQAPVNPWPWGGAFYDEDLRSGVNDTNGGRLHTYCGGVWHD